MYVKAEGMARIRHKDTGVIYDIAADELYGSGEGRLTLGCLSV